MATNYADPAADTDLAIDYLLSDMRRAAPWSQSPAASSSQPLPEQGIRTVFQPIVDLRSGAVVGFEALSRGPEGSGLEDPLVLLAAAKSAGRIGEIDWVCRALAVAAALRSRLPGQLTWFINVEPDALTTPCPPYLYPVFRRASTRLRIILEITERYDESHIPALTELAAIARRNGWGIALDDVGADESAFRLLPLLAPDVVKLDASLLDPQESRKVATVQLVLDQFRRDGHRPHLLAEGIETREQAERARHTLRATLGQGFSFGWPEPLPDTMPSSGTPVDIAKADPQGLLSTPAGSGVLPWAGRLGHVPQRKEEVR